MTLDEIQTAIINQLKSKTTFKTIKQYQGDFDRINVIALPAALVVYERGEYERSNNVINRTGYWTVIITTSGINKAKRINIAYGFLNDTRSALWNFSPCIGSGIMELKKESLLVSTQSYIVFAQDYYLKDRITL